MIPEVILVYGKYSIMLLEEALTKVEKAGMGGFGHFVNVVNGCFGLLWAS